MNYLNKSFTIYVGKINNNDNNCSICRKQENYLYRINNVIYCKNCYDYIQKTKKQKLLHIVNNILYKLFLNE